MSKYLIAGNWKMNTNADETQKLVSDLSASALKSQEVEMLVCPPFINIPSASELLKDSFIHLGAQNCYFEEKGAYTGEISIPMLKAFNLGFIIIGHSERRAYFNESDELISKKLEAILKYNLKPILCIGETLEERNAGKTFEILKNQLDIDLSKADQSKIKDIVIAYEPVWAIGTGVSATNEQVAEAHKWIREYLESRYKDDAADIKILYGGSLNDANAKEILAIANVNGGLIGGASLKSESFLKIYNTAIELS